MIAAVSGGADSVSTLIALHELKNELKLNLSVGHFDHQLRESSSADAEWVKELASQFGLECEVGSPEDLPHRIGPIRSEENARNQRYAWLKSFAQRIDTKWIAVAHTADDQVETILHHIIRGTGLNGLQGMPQVRELTSKISLVRPALGLRRDELHQILTTTGQPIRLDETNLENRWTRNRIRNDLLPLLRDDFNPKVDESLLRLAQQAAQAQRALEELARPLAEVVIISSNSESLLIDQQKLKTNPPGLIAEVFVQLWEKMNWPRQGMSQAHWNTLVAMISNGEPIGVSLPGRIEAKLRRRQLVIARQ